MRSEPLRIHPVRMPIAQGGGYTEILCTYRGNLKTVVFSMPATSALREPRSLPSPGCQSTQTFPLSDLLQVLPRLILPVPSIGLYSFRVRLQMQIQIVYSKPPSVWLLCFLVITVFKHFYTDFTRIFTQSKHRSHPTSNRPIALKDS